MKLNHKVNRLSESTFKNKADFGILDENMGDVMELFRKKMYKNPKLAVIREYATNAYDAHVEANIAHTPILIVAPTLEHPTLRIRDYGKGLSADEIRMVYIQYGNSTKRESNSFTGCLGIGCKAGFAYGNVFTIISYYNGTRYTWVASATTGDAGTASLIDETPCGMHETGIEIQVSIKPSDIEDFNGHIEKLAPYFTVIPTVENLEITPIEYAEEGDTWRLLPDTAQSGNNWRRDYGNTKALMGNIVYPVSTDDMGSNLNESIKSILSCSNLIIDYPIGSLDIAGSRETLEYTQRTIDNLSIQATQVLKDMASKLQDGVNDATNHWKASIYAINTTNGLPSEIKKGVLKQLKYQGQDILEKITLPLLVECHHKKHQYRNSIYQNARKTQGSIPVKPKMHVCSYDADTILPANATRRIRTLQEAEGHDPEAEYYAIPLSNLDIEDSDKLGFISHKFMSPPPKDTDKAEHEEAKRLNKSTLYLLKDCITDLNNIAPLKPKKAARKLSSGPSVKIEVCKLIENRTITSQLVPIQTDDLDTDIEREPALNVVVYIPLDRFSWHNPPGEATLEPGNLEKYRTAGEIMIKHRVKDLEQSLTIYGVKRAYLAKIPASWMTYNAWFTKMLEYYQNNKEYELDLIHQSGTKVNEEWVDDCTLHEVFAEIAKDKTLEMHAEWKLLADIENTHQIKNLYGETLKSPLVLKPEHYNSLHNIAINLGLIERPNYHSEEKWYATQAKLLERWPLLKYIDSYYYGDNTHIIKALKGYLTTYPPIQQPTAVPNDLDEHKTHISCTEDQPASTITGSSDQSFNPFR